MAVKIGTVRWKASIDEETGQIELTEWVLRSAQMRKRLNGITWYDGPKLTHYWVIREKGITWGKRSKKHGDVGWLPNIPDYCRKSVLAKDGPIYSASKRGALRVLLADTRAHKKAWGDHDPLFPDELPYSVHIQKIKARLAREKN